jgi:ubiquinone/menaquinone biosynthesis C-methylase UbiE
MTTEIYTPGYDRMAIDFMRRRTMASHAHFIEPLLKPGMRMLDLGCGPGTITLEIYPENAPIVEHIASQLERDGQKEHASVWRTWGENPEAMFAQAWFESTAFKP